jgi:hypothetical protein
LKGASAATGQDVRVQEAPVRTLLQHNVSVEVSAFMSRIAWGQYEGACALAGEIARFRIDARSVDGVPLRRGGAALFWSRLVSGDLIARSTRLPHKFDGIIVPVHMRDLRNGSYIGEYVVFEPG